MGCTLALIPIRVSSGWTNTIMEAQPVYGAHRVAKGSPLYAAPWQTNGFALTYGALTYEVPGRLAKLTGRTQSVSAEFVLRAGRLQSLAAFLVLLVVIATVAKQYADSVKIAAVAVLPAFWFPFISEWYSDFVPDAPALACSAAGWLLALLARRRIIWLGFAAGILWCGAFFYKPTALLGLVGYAVAEFPRRGESVQQWRRFISPFAVCGLAVLIMGAVVEVGTGGLWLNHMIGSQALCDVRVGNVLEALQQAGMAGKIMLVCMAAVAVANIDFPLFRAFVVLALLETAMMMKQGSNVHYLLGSVLLWGVAVAASLSRWYQVQSGVYYRQAVVIAGLTGICICLVCQWRAARVVLWEGIIPTSEEIQVVDQGIVAPGGVLAVEPYYGLTRNTSLAFVDSFHASLMERQGYVRVADALQRGEFQYVVANRFWLEPAVYQESMVVPERARESLLRNYVIERRGMWLVLFRVRENRRL
ncbi:MAG: hypothetical protein ACR2IE_05045 [Candidatus Sumerlaeaceae bacterium]